MTNTNLSNIHESFLELVRLGIGTSENVTIPQNTDWIKLKALADEQGLSAIVLDGVEKLPKEQQPSQMLLLQWIGEVLGGYEPRYELYQKAISELAGFYNQHGYKMMVLKGLACSLDWPKPEHRLCGDIDIWQFGQYKEADAALAKEIGIVIDNSHHHHTVFEWNGFTVENHYDFINVHHHKSHVALEKIFKELGKDDSHSVEVCGEKIYLPSPNLHALFLLKHMMLHFVATEFTIRQLLDWALFVEKHGNNVDWEWLKVVLDENGMIPMFNIINAICVEDLGFDASLFPTIQFAPLVKERALNEILSPEFSVKLPRNVFHRVVYKYRRWRGSAWKHELCYKESMWSAFWSGVWVHLLKPSSI